MGTYTFQSQTNLKGTYSDEAKRLTASIVDKLPSFALFWKTIFDVSSGKYVDITEKTIDEAYDSMIDREKLRIECSQMLKEDKEHEKIRQEILLKSDKEWFISQLKLKE